MDIKEQIINEIKILLDKLKVEYDVYAIVTNRDYKYYQDKLVNKLGIYKIDWFVKKRPVEALHLYIKEIALEYDSLYSGHIKDVEWPHAVTVRKGDDDNPKLFITQIENSKTNIRPLFRNRDEACKAIDLAIKWYHSIVLS